jgi:class 3 adenylate cyclase
MISHKNQNNTRQTKTVRYMTDAGRVTRFDSDLRGEYDCCYRSLPLVPVPIMTVAETARAATALGVESRSILPDGMVALFGAGASMLMCYNKLLLVNLALFTGSIPQINPHLQAVLMWVFGAIAVYGLVQDRKIHGSLVPMVLGAVAVMSLVVSLYGYYLASVESSSYVLLLTAAFTNQIKILNHLNRQVKIKASEVEELNSGLEQRVRQQVGEIDRLNQLKRFLSPEVANLVTEQQEKTLLQSHRAYIAALYCDLRGFTSFSNSMEPEEVINVLQAYHEGLGQLVADFQGTIDHRAGDGMMVFFNDPLPCDEPVFRAVELALGMRERFVETNRDWCRRGYELGFGVGIASGYATLGIVGYEGRYDYTANGNAVNLCARLSDEARDGQILIDHKTYIEVEDRVEVEAVGEVELKGFNSKTRVYDLRGLRG